MKVQSSYPQQYKNIYNSSSDLINTKEEDEKINKKESKKYNYNSNVAGQGTKEESNSEESNEDTDKITSKIVINPTGIRTLLMLRNSKVFSSVKLGETNNLVEEPSKEEISDEDLSNIETANAE